MIEVKPEVNFNDLKEATPSLLIVFAGAYEYCSKRKLPFILSSLFSDRVSGRVSKTHLEKRAFDLSVRGWTRTQIDDFILYMNEKFEHLAAISSSTGKPCLIPPVDHGNAPHLHVQVKP